MVELLRDKSELRHLVACVTGDKSPTHSGSQVSHLMDNTSSANVTQGVRTKEICVDTWLNLHSYKISKAKVY